MPQRKCAAKRLRADRQRSAHNFELKSGLKKELKGLRLLVRQGKLDEAKSRLRQAFAKFDRAAAKGILHKNTAARRKSVLSRLLHPAPKTSS